MQLRYAILFPRLMKTNPVARKIALTPLSEALTAGKSWMLMGAPASGTARCAAIPPTYRAGGRRSEAPGESASSSRLAFELAHSGDDARLDGVRPVPARTQSEEHT